MAKTELQAGAAQRVITPRVGIPLVGWHFRAAGDNLSRYVHDDLYVKSLVLRDGDQAWALLATDLVGVDALATDRIRRGVSQQLGLAADAILVSATHCHSGPAACPVASAQAPDARAGSTVQADGSMRGHSGQTARVAPTAYYVGEVDEEWKAWFISQAIAATVDAWHSTRPAEVAFGEVEARGLGSSRRVRLADGSWADPRRDEGREADVVSRTDVDPWVRVMLVREPGTEIPLAGVINYGSHPWVFSIPGFSAELAGATADAVADAWRSPDADPPVVLYTTGPQGDVTLIWNIDIDNVWRTHPGETAQDSLARRVRAYDIELARLSKIMTERVMAAIAGASGWTSSVTVRVGRREVALPLKEGYTRPPAVVVAPWQEHAGEGHHLTEVQALWIGDSVILGLPGEPFVSLGQAIRARAPSQHVIIVALANDFGGFGYIADHAAYALGGYELDHTPTAPGAGEVLVEQAIALLETATVSGSKG